MDNKYRTTAFASRTSPSPPLPVPVLRNSVSAHVFISVCAIDSHLCDMFSLKVATSAKAQEALGRDDESSPVRLWKLLIALMLPCA